MLCAVAPWVLMATAFLLAANSQATPSFANALTNGMLNISGLSEVSGVAASRNNDNVLWVHNDSGHPAVAYAIDTQGRKLGIYNLPGNVDNEDIAIGPGPITNVSYLYVGDIGDNSSNRSNIKIYQIPEPVVYARQFTNPAAITPKGSRTITLTYPDGARDAEAMFVDPVTGDFFILSKEAISRVYTASKSQLDTNNSFALTFLRSLSFNVPSAADISPSGNEIIVRQENFARLWIRAAGQSIDAAFSGTAITIPVVGTANGEPNGEAIGYDSVGRGYFTLSDSGATPLTNQPIRYFARTSNDGPAARQTLVAAGSSWAYLDNGTDQGTAWRDRLFDSSVWSNGIAQFGYGEGDEQTRVASNHITTYFRRTFDVQNAAAVTNLALKLLVNNGAAVFLNGAAIAYYNLATNAVFNTAATQQPLNLQDTWLSYPVSPSNLTNGVNTLAVEVHQTSVVSSNLSFDLQLLAICQPPAGPSVSLTSLPNAVEVCWPASVAGYALEQSASLVSGGSWSLAPEPVYIWSDQFFMTNSSPVGMRYYRLHHP